MMFIRRKQSGRICFFEGLAVQMPLPNPQATESTHAFMARAAVMQRPLYQHRFVSDFNEEGSACRVP
jgi:hypothetical protein